MTMKNKSPLVTIVIPAYNHEAYVEDAINSVLDQHYENWELIVIDDGSNDDTGRICDKFASYEKITVLHQENQGLSNTLNRGLEMASGKYFGFLPSDDRFYPEKLLIQVDFLEKHPEIAGVGSLQTVIDKRGKTIQDKVMEEWFSYIPDSRPDFLLKLLERNFVPAPSMLLLKDVVENVGGFDSNCKYMQDYDLWFRILKNHELRILPKRLIQYRWHGKNLTYEATDETERERGMVFEKAAKLLEITDLYPELWERFRPEVIALCRADLHQRLRVNPTPNFEEIHGIFDEKFTQLWRKREELNIPREILEEYSPAYTTTTDKPGVIIEVTSLDTGGLEQVVHDLAIGLKKRDMPVTVVCIRAGGLNANRLKDKGIRVEILPLNHKETAYEQIIENSNATIINAHYSNFGAKIALDRAIPFVSTIHNIYAWLPDFGRDGIRELDALTTHYIAVSEDVKTFFCHRFAIDDKKVTVIPNGLDIDLWLKKEDGAKNIRKDLNISDDDFLFLTPATISRVKGQDRILKALALIKKKCPKVKAIFLGSQVDAPFFTYLKKLIHQLDLKDRVLFQPFDEDPASWYFSADAFVLPSLIEGWSISMLEAMFARLPLIMTEIAGAKTVVSESNCGITVKSPFDSLWQLDMNFLEKYSMMDDDPVVSPLADAMMKICSEPSKWEKAGQRARELVISKYSLDKQTENYEGLFSKIISYYSSTIAKQAGKRVSRYKKALEFSQRTIEKTYESQRQGYWLKILNEQLLDAWKQIHDISLEKDKQEQLIKEQHAEIQRLKAELQAIYNSRGWKLIQSGRKLKGIINKN